MSIAGSTPDAQLHFLMPSQTDSQSTVRLQISIHRIMQVDTVRDELMYWLEPMDALCLRLTCRGLVPGKDMPKYTSVFKYIIPNRRWLCRKLKDGYDFIVISEGLKQMMQMKTTTNARLSPTEVFLVVAKDKRLIPCNERFLPTDLFAMAEDDGTKTVYGNSDKTMADTTRMLVLHRFGVEINLTCRTAWAEHTVISCSRIKAAFKSNSRSNSSNIYETTYAQMASDICKIRLPMRDRSSFEGKMHQAKTLFTTVIARDDIWLPFIFRFDTTKQSYSHYTLFSTAYRADVEEMFQRS